MGTGWFFLSFFNGKTHTLATNPSVSAELLISDDCLYLANIDKYGTYHIPDTVGSIL